MNGNDRRPKRSSDDLLDSIVGSDVMRWIGASLMGSVSLIMWLWAGSIGVTQPFPCFVLAVVPFAVACGIAFGYRAGLAATALSGVVGLYVILPPRFSFSFTDDNELLFFAAVLIGTACATHALGSRAAQGSDR